MHNFDWKPTQCISKSIFIRIYTIISVWHRSEPPALKLNLGVQNDLLILLTISQRNSNSFHSLIASSSILQVINTFTEKDRLLSSFKDIDIVNRKAGLNSLIKYDQTTALIWIKGQVRPGKLF